MYDCVGKTLPDFSKSKLWSGCYSKKQLQFDVMADRNINELRMLSLLITILGLCFCMRNIYLSNPKSGAFGLGRGSGPPLTLVAGLLLILQSEL